MPVGFDNPKISAYFHYGPKDSVWPLGTKSTRQLCTLGMKSSAAGPVLSQPGTTWYP